MPSKRNRVATKAMCYRVYFMIRSDGSFFDGTAHINNRQIHPASSVEYTILVLFSITCK